MKKYSYKVVGVTFPARDGSDRQKNLKQLFEEDMELGISTHAVKLEGYDFEGAPALAVLLDGTEAGNIPADIVMDVIEIGRKATVCEVTLTLNGRDFEDAKDIIEFYRDRHEMVKDGTIHELDLDDIEEKYTELMKDGAVYSAIVHFMILDEQEAEEHKKMTEVVSSAANKEPEPKPKKEQEESKAKPGQSPMKSKATFIICVILIAMSLLLAFVVPPAGIIGILIGVWGIVQNKKNDKGTTGPKKK